MNRDTSCESLDPTGGRSTPRLSIPNQSRHGEHDVRLLGPGVDHLDGVGRQLPPVQSLAGRGQVPFGAERAEPEVQVARVVQDHDPRARRPAQGGGQRFPVLDPVVRDRAVGRQGKTLKCPTAVVTSLPTTGVKYGRTPALRAAAR